MNKRALIAGASVSFGLAVADLALLNLHLVPTALVAESVAAERAGEPADETVRVAAAAPTPKAAPPEPAAPAAEPAAPAALPEPVAAAAAPAGEPTPAPEPEDEQRFAEPVIIRFATADDALDARAQRQLDEVAAVLEAELELSAHIQGHADERGTFEYNEDLAERRASRVADYLAERGIGADRLLTESFGESRPLVVGAGGDAWRKNRRVELRIERGSP